MKKISLIAAAGLMSVSALAASTTTAVPTGNTTTGTTAAAAPSLIDNLTVKLVSEIYGPALENTGMYRTQAKDGQLDLGSPVGIDNSARLGYKINKDVTASIAYNGVYSFVNGAGMTMEDPFVQIVDAKLISHGNFNMLGAFRVYGGLTEASKKVDRLATIRITQDSTYQLGNSRWTAEFSAYAQPSVFTADAEAGKSRNNTFFYAAPSINYQFTPTLSAQLAYELAANQKSSDAFTNWHAYEPAATDFMPNVSWDVTPNINLNPYMYIMTGDRVAADTTITGMVVSLKFL